MSLLIGMSVYLGTALVLFGYGAEPSLVGFAGLGVLCGIAGSVVAEVLDL